MATQILDGLEALHRQDIIHRDIKPSNLFVVVRGGRPAVKILDFGVGRLLSSSGERLTKVGTALGTPEYMAPEQLRGEDVGKPADVYAVGAVLYELIAGVPPLGTGTFDELLARAHRSRPPGLGERIAGLPAGLTDVVDRALSRDPDGRWADARSMRSALEQVRRGEWYHWASEPTAASDHRHISVDGIDDVTEPSAIDDPTEPSAIDDPTEPSAIEGEGLDLGKEPSAIEGEGLDLEEEPSAIEAAPSPVVAVRTPIAPNVPMTPAAPPLPSAA
ncbi:MAG: serine/threonine-protein kinase, partial [Myxococcota bacterium]